VCIPVISCDDRMGRVQAEIRRVRLFPPLFRLACGKLRVLESQKEGGKSDERYKAFSSNQFQDRKPCFAAIT